MQRLLTAIVVVFIATIASAQTRSVFIEDLTSYELRDAMAAGKTSAILFAGGIEQNGPHMALIKHNLIVPSPVQDYVTSRVLTMEFIHGRKVTSMGPLARLEMESVIKALVGCADTLEPGTPERRLNNIVRGLARLPLRVS